MICFCSIFIELYRVVVDFNSSFFFENILIFLLPIEACGSDVLSIYIESDFFLNL